MTVYKAFHQDNESKGSIIQATLAAFDESDILHLLNKYGFSSLKADEWYPQQLELDLLRDLYEEKSFMDMVAIGMKIPDVASFPPHIDSVHEALALLDDAYRMNIRGVDIGNYNYHRVGDREAKMVCRNPYPSDFDYGLIYRVVQKFSDKSSGITVKRDDDIPNRNSGGDTCVYYISW